MYIRSILVFFCLQLNVLPVFSINGQPETIGPKYGYLVIAGGGDQLPSIKKFMTLMGKQEPKIVVITTAAGDEALTQKFNTETRSQFAVAGAKNINILHTRDTTVANSDSFLKFIKEADGVWFTGGRQWRLADAYLHTKVLSELDSLLERGGVVGGNSAGATIQGSFLVRGDTRSASIMDGDHKIGFGFLKNSAIDQHILERNRQFDLLEIRHKYPELLCIGIDVNTAIVVHANQFEVIGTHYVSIFDGTFWNSETGEITILQIDSDRFYFLKAGDKYDLRARRIIKK